MFLRQKQFQKRYAQVWIVRLFYVQEMNFNFIAVVIKKYAKVYVDYNQFLSYYIYKSFTQKWSNQIQCITFKLPLINI